MKCVSCDDESITPPQQQSGEASVSEGQMSGCSASCWSYLFLVYIISLVILLLIRVLLLWVGPEHEEPELHTHWKLNDAPQSNIFSILLHLHNIMMLKPRLNDEVSSHTPTFKQGWCLIAGSTLDPVSGFVQLRHDVDNMQVYSLPESVLGNEL